MQNYLDNAIDKVLEQLRLIPMSDSTVKYYKSCLKSLSAYCGHWGVETFTTQTAAEFFLYQQGRLKRGEITQVYCLTLRRAAFLLAEYLETGAVNWKRMVYNQTTMCNAFEDALSGFENSLAGSLSPGSISLVTQMARRFFQFLEEKGISRFEQVSTEDIRGFVVCRAPKHKGNMVNLTWPIRRLFAYLNTTGLSTLDADRLLANVAPSPKKVLPCFSAAEAESILAAVDMTTALGKRDYAIIKLALGTGLRCIDICSLKLMDIDWRKNEVSIVQSKTGNHIVLPLMPDVGNAVAEYILSGRPHTDSPYIFLRHRKPHDWLGNGPAGAIIINRYQKKAGMTHAAWDGKTFHAFRRTVGTRLVQAEVPLAEVAQILGHRRIESAKRYIALHDEMLRVCCMDIADYATTKEGLA